LEKKNDLLAEVISDGGSTFLSAKFEVVSYKEGVALGKTQRVYPRLWKSH